ncbi:MAG: 50S ribosomal protein L44e [Promethearchaeota archaeon]
MPKNKRIHCPKCQKHTPHKVNIYKKGKDRIMAHGGKDRIMAHGKRRYNRKKAGYGSQPKPIQHNQAKVNKKTTPLYKCAVCGHVQVGKAQRLKKFEILNK